MRVTATITTPYCGAPPHLDTLAARWNLDSRLLLALALLAIGYLVARKSRTAGQTASFATGWAVTALALVSPLCALSVSLFAARVGQHMILTLVAAPLVALGLPRLRATVPGREAFAAFGFAAALWGWHSPTAYDLTFTSVAAYWAMHVTTWGAAVLFWWAVLRAPAERAGGAIVVTVVTGLQMALLGAIITWAPQPLYWPHLVTPYEWGLTPLADQQLGGALMWVPGGAIFLVAIVAPLAALLRRPPSALTPLRGA